MRRKPRSRTPTERTAKFTLSSHCFQRCAFGWGEAGARSVGVSRARSWRPFSVHVRLRRKSAPLPPPSTLSTVPPVAVDLLTARAVATLRSCAGDGPFRDSQESGGETKRPETKTRLGTRFKLFVELGGFEPPTFSLRTRRATNCAIAPFTKETLPREPKPPPADLKSVNDSPSAPTTLPAMSEQRGNSPGAAIERVAGRGQNPSRT